MLYRSYFLSLITKTKHVHTLIAETPFFFGSYKWVRVFTPSIFKIICANASIKNNFIKAGYNPKKLEVITLGVNARKFDNKKFDKELLLKKYALPQDVKVVLFLAPIEPHKGPEIFIKGAVHALKRWGQKKNLLFLVATYKSPGKIPYEQRKQDFISKANGFRKHFKIIEGKHNVPELMAMSDLVCFPQVSTDGATGHPVTLLEAMSAKCLVLASDLAGLTEVVEHNKTGFLFKNKDYEDMGNKLLEAINSKNKSEIVEKAYKEIYDKYNIDIVAEKIVKVYESNK